MSTTPEQLETTAVEPDADEATTTRPTGEATTTRPTGEATTTPSTGDELVVEDLVVEDVSIDGMCGVY